tara:strand:+ start:1058 stop:1291 length:234 start_codon:yes stop_codon:yes gene_type:complete
MEKRGQMRRGYPTTLMLPTSQGKLVYVGTVVMNPEKQHKKLFDLQTKAAVSISREAAKKILKKYEKAMAKLARASQL